MASIIGAMLVPSGLAYILFALGLLTALKAQWRKLSWALLAISGAITTVFSTGSVATALLSPLDAAIAYWTDLYEIQPTDAERDVLAASLEAVGH